MSAIQNAVERAVNKALGMDTSAASTDVRKQIVILQRGWVVVGDVSINGDDVTVANASVVRVWGTTNGIGEIAIGGPTKDTVLDKCGTVRAHRASVVAYVDCDSQKWSGR